MECKAAATKKANGFNDWCTTVVLGDSIAECLVEVDVSCCEGPIDEGRRVSCLSGAIVRKSKRREEGMSNQNKAESMPAKSSLNRQEQQVKIEEQECECPSRSRLLLQVRGKQLVHRRLSGNRRLQYG
jgi:hypothetical protein